MAVNRVKILWKNSIIETNIKNTLKLYVNNATFKGTYMVKGSKGKENIENYFKKFSPIVNDIKFKSDEITVRTGNIINEIGSYKFYTTKGVIDAQYNFVFLVKNEEAKILSHFSTLFIK